MQKVVVVIRQHGIRDQPETAQVRINKPPTCKFQCLLVTVELLLHPLKSLIKRSFIKDEINSTKLFLKRTLFRGWQGGSVVLLGHQARWLDPALMTEEGTGSQSF